KTDLLVKSPCAGVKPPPVEPVEMRFLTAAEVHRLAEEMHPHFRVLVYTAAYAGLRWGELLGLNRARGDIANRTITVLEQLVEVKGQFVWQPPKTRAGRRRVTIPGFLADMLAEQLAHRALPGPAGLVFPNRAGKPIATSSFNTAHWKPAKQRAGIDGLRWHDLRHTAVALAIAQGAHPTGIQARLGHSSVHVTLDRYGHLFPELDAAIADGLEGAFREVPMRPRKTPPVTQPGHRRHAEDTKSWHLAANPGHPRTRQKGALTRENTQRRRAELNRCTGFCRPSICNIWTADDGVLRAGPALPHVRDGVRDPGPAGPGRLRGAAGDLLRRGAGPRRRGSGTLQPDL